MPEDTLEQSFKDALALILFLNSAFDSVVSAFFVFDSASKNYNGARERV